MTSTGEDFRYGALGAGPHALTSVYLPSDNFRPPPDSTSYTCFNKIACITDTLEGNIPLKLDVIYGTDDQRIKSVLTEDSQTKRTKYYFGDYEEITENGTTKKYYYFNSPTGICGIFVKTVGSQSDTLWNAYTDHLGSLIYELNSFFGSSRTKKCKLSHPDTLVGIWSMLIMQTITLNTALIPGEIQERLMIGVNC